MRYLPAVSPLDALQTKLSVYIYSNMSCTCTYSYYPVTLYKHMLQNNIMAYNIYMYIYIYRSHRLVSILRYMCNNQTTPTLQGTKISHLGKRKIIDSTVPSEGIWDSSQEGTFQKIHKFFINGHCTSPSFAACRRPCKMRCRN